MFDDGLGLYLATSAFALAVLIHVRRYWDSHSGSPLPPGPTPLPVLGNFLSIDAAQPWVTFNSWKSTYGEIIYARLLSKPVVVMNSVEVTKDLFEGRSHIYSDKPQSILHEPFAVDFNVVFMPYGDRWRLHRRILHQTLRQAEIHSYHAAQRRSAHKMLFSLLQDPENYLSHFQMFIMSFMLPIVYDYEPKAQEDPIVDAMTRYGDLMVDNTAPGPWVVMETFPFLLQLPSWFPGATFKRASVKCIQAGHDIQELPFQYVKESMSTRGTAPCLVADALNRMRLSEEDDGMTTAIKEAASIAFAAASETSTSTLCVFLLAMVLNPEAQAKAQAEINQVVGKDRLPDFDDRPAMPYLEAILRETLRWHPVTPLSTPHTTTTSDIYKGYFIPKGVLVYANIWAMTHDEKKYPSPDEFKPERFLHEDGSLTSDTMLLGFGLGRRSCVGRHLADASLWIAIASFLAGFSAHKALDKYGMDIPIVPKFSSGTIIHPEKFPCRIVPRFPGASVRALTHLTGLEQS
ncbi:cytochrome P450 [Suillus clintonianus]|uniref:cytochrome P450 n=1 Tax=Suillus clintonianus TaxID=1904413 RepID=UPI001B85CD69|nr:cytochrome P450 [Suillus clintonianus]KAG2137947.1 cytochrome P450 [Suillus clintonianus]